MCVSKKTITRFNGNNCLLLRFVSLLGMLLCSVRYCHGDVKTGPGADVAVELATVGSTLDLQLSDSDFEQLVEAKLNESAKQMHAQDLLSRKRRYLLFPEGSSFQMVYDEIVGVVDHTNYLILGITVALAWELPSKPPSEILEDLQTKLSDGTLDISRNDTTSNITYVDDAKQSQQSTQNNSTAYKPNYINLYATGKPSGNMNSYYSMQPAFRTPMHPVHQYVDSYYRRPTPLPGVRRKDSYYYSYYRPKGSIRNPFVKWTKPFSAAAANHNSRYPYWSLPSRLRDSFRNNKRHYSSARIKSQQYAPPVAQRRQGYAPKPVAPQAPVRHHRIYPVFGKRSISDAADPHHRQRRSGVAAHSEAAMNKLDRLQIKYHRNSRQQLYERIERYLDKRGHHGQHCVLRTLCETGQKSQEQEPGSFLGELMRAIFTIPEALENEPIAYQDARYDKAHAYSGNCAKLYPMCKQSMWQADFIQ